MTAAIDELEHGSAGYRKGCKCEVCRTAHRDYMRVWRSRQRSAAAAEAGEELLRTPAADRGELVWAEQRAGSWALVRHLAVPLLINAVLWAVLIALGLWVASLVRGLS